MKTFVIKYKLNIIGVYNDITQAKLFIRSCLSNNLMYGFATILVYTSNSCCCTNTIKVFINKEENIKEENIKEKNIHKENINKKNRLLDIKKKEQENDEIKKKLDINKQDIDKKNKENLLKLAENKIIIQHKLNMLNVQKKKMAELKNIYDNDIVIYYKLQKNTKIDSSFVIPEIFRDKYAIFKQLENNDNLTWETFYDESKRGKTIDVRNILDKVQDKVQDKEINENDFKLNDYEQKFVSKPNFCEVFDS